MRKWLILMSALALPLTSSQAAWRWVDENGVVHYSDRPVPGAVEVELRGIDVFEAPAPRVTAPRPAPAQPEPAPTYQAFGISSPSPDETLWNIEGTLSVSLEIAPGLQPGHTVDLVFDGERRMRNSRSAQLTLSDVYRGVHTLQALLLDATGAVVLRSEPVTFTVMQTSILNPNNPNNVN